MKSVAEFMSSSLHQSLPAGQALVNITSTDRFAMYKVGPVLTVSVRIALSPVSIQTQSLALRALRKRKPQETQALALASSQ